MNSLYNYCCHWERGICPFSSKLECTGLSQECLKPNLVEICSLHMFRAAFSVLKGIFSYLHFKIDEALHWRSSSLYLKMIYANDLCLVEISFVVLLKNLFSKVTKVLSVFIYLFVIIFPGREFGWYWFSDFRVEY